MDPRRVLPALAATTAVVVVATLVALGWRTVSTGADAGGTPAPASAPASTARPGSGQRHDAGPSAVAVLAAWDAARARAWAEGGAGALRRLYVEGSPSGAADVDLLRSYAGRGLRVTGLQTQVLDLEVVAEDPRRLELVVTDRVVGGRAVGGGRSVTLPRDRPSTRTVVLVRERGRWLVHRVRDVPAGRRQPRAAASTSRTSRSSKS